MNTNSVIPLGFPKQRVSTSEKKKPEWYANCCDYVIAAGIAANDEEEITNKYDILKGNIPNEYYRKILNPYNSKNKDYQRFPATMRNYDIVKGIIRRYVGEYIQNPHDFIVGANNPEVMLARNAKLRSELTAIVQKQIADRIQQAYQEFVQQGNPPEQFNPQQAIDIDAFIKEFNENYVDDITAQGQDILNVIDDLTESATIYAQAYFEWVSFGRFFTYSDVVGNKLIKRVVKNKDAFPVPNDNILVEDFDMFAERRKMTRQQILDEFGENLSKEQINFIDNYYNTDRTLTTDDRGLLTWDKYKSYFPDICNKFSKEERELFSREPTIARDLNSGLYDVWHVVWRGEVKQGILTYQQNGIIGERVVDETYKLNTENGDISIEWIWTSQVYECDRIGGRNDAIYPYGCRPISFNRNGKLPYNGIIELLPGFGKFSIIDIVLPFQIFGNIVAYHREMAIAKNKLNVLMIAKSLLGTKPEQTIYQMAADGVLYIDDEDDAGMLKAQQVRMLNSQNNDYISQLGQLIQENEQVAMMKVDMTPQRYGAIANSAGKGVTDQAIIRGSMGSVIVEYMFDYAREHDYMRDMDYTKLAWIDGLDTTYKRKNDSQIQYFSLDIEKHLYADYIVKAKLSAKERDKLNQYKQFAFSAAQNGDMNMAVAAIEGDNSADIKKMIMKFQQIKIQNEQTMKQMEQQIKQMEQEFELKKISATGEQNRQTIALEKYLDSQIEQLKVFTSGDNGAENYMTTQANIAKNNIEREKLNIERDKNRTDAEINKEKIKADIYKADTQYKIAKANKNKYD